MTKRPAVKPETSTEVVLRMARQKATRTEVLDALCSTFQASRERSAYFLETLEARCYITEVDGRIELVG